MSRPRQVVHTARGLGTAELLHYTIPEISPTEVYPVAAIMHSSEAADAPQGSPVPELAIGAPRSRSRSGSPSGQTYSRQRLLASSRKTKDMEEPQRAVLYQQSQHKCARLPPARSGDESQQCSAERPNASRTISCLSSTPQSSNAQARLATTSHPSPGSSYKGQKLPPDVETKGSTYGGEDRNSLPVLVSTAGAPSGGAPPRDTIGINVPRGPDLPSLTHSCLGENELAEINGSSRYTGQPMTPSAELPPELSPQSVLQKKTPPDVGSQGAYTADAAILLSGSRNHLNVQHQAAASHGTPNAPPTHLPVSEDCLLARDQTGLNSNTQQQTEDMQVSHQGNTSKSAGVASEPTQDTSLKKLSTFSKEELLGGNAEISDVPYVLLRQIAVKSREDQQTKLGKQAESTTDPLERSILHSKTAVVSAGGCAPQEHDASIRREKTMAEPMTAEIASLPGNTFRGRSQHSCLLSHQAPRRSLYCGSKTSTGRDITERLVGDSATQAPQAVTSVQCTASRRSPQRLKERLLLRNTPLYHVENSQVTPSASFSLDRTGEFSLGVGGDGRKVGQEQGPTDIHLVECSIPAAHPKQGTHDERPSLLVISSGRECRGQVGHFPRSRCQGCSLSGCDRATKTYGFHARYGIYRGIGGCSAAPDTTWSTCTAPHETADVSCPTSQQRYYSSRSCGSGMAHALAYSALVGHAACEEGVNTIASNKKLPRERSTESCKGYSRTNAPASSVAAGSIEVPFESGNEDLTNQENAAEPLAIRRTAPPKELKSSQIYAAESGSLICHHRPLGRLFGRVQKMRAMSQRDIGVHRRNTASHKKPADEQGHLQVSRRHWSSETPERGAPSWLEKRRHGIWGGKSVGEACTHSCRRTCHSASFATLLTLTREQLLPPDKRGAPDPGQFKAVYEALPSASSEAAPLENILGTELPSTVQVISRADSPSANDLGRPGPQDNSYSSQCSAGAADEGKSPEETKQYTHKRQLAERSHTCYWNKWRLNVSQEQVHALSRYNSLRSSFPKPVFQDTTAIPLHVEHVAKPPPQSTPDRTSPHNCSVSETLPHGCQALRWPNTGPHEVSLDVRWVLRKRDPPLTVRASSAALASSFRGSMRSVGPHIVRLRPTSLQDGSGPTQLRTIQKSVLSGQSSMTAPSTEWLEGRATRRKACRETFSNRLSDGHRPKTLRGFLCDGPVHFASFQMYQQTMPRQCSERQSKKDVLSQQAEGPTNLCGWRHFMELLQHDGKPADAVLGQQDANPCTAFYCRAQPLVDMSQPGPHLVTDHQGGQANQKNSEGHSSKDTAQGCLATGAPATQKTGDLGSANLTYCCGSTRRTGLINMASCSGQAPYIDYIAGGQLPMQMQEALPQRTCTTGVADVKERFFQRRLLIQRKHVQLLQKQVKMQQQHLQWALEFQKAQLQQQRDQPVLSCSRLNSEIATSRLSWRRSLRRGTSWSRRRRSFCGREKPFAIIGSAAAAAAAAAAAVSTWAERAERLLATPQSINRPAGRLADISLEPCKGTHLLAAANGQVGKAKQQMLALKMSEGVRVAVEEIRKRAFVVGDIIAGFDRQRGPMPSKEEQGMSEACLQQNQHPKFTADLSQAQAGENALCVGEVAKELQLSTPAGSARQQAARRQAAESNSAGPMLPRASSAATCPRPAAGVDLSSASLGNVSECKGFADEDTVSQVGHSVTPQVSHLCHFLRARATTVHTLPCGTFASEGRRHCPSDRRANAATYRHASSPRAATATDSSKHHRACSTVSCPSLRTASYRPRSSTRCEPQRNAEAGASGDDVMELPFVKVQSGTSRRYRCNAVPMAYQRDPSVSIFNQLFEDRVRRQRNLDILRRQEQLKESAFNRDGWRRARQGPRYKSTQAVALTRQHTATSCILEQVPQPTLQNDSSSVHSFPKHSKKRVVAPSVKLPTNADSACASANRSSTHKGSCIRLGSDSCNNVSSKKKPLPIKTSGPNPEVIRLTVQAAATCARDYTEIDGALARAKSPKSPESLRLCFRTAAAMEAESIR